MNYSKILKQLTIKENVSVDELESEMRAAINSAGLNCTVKDFIVTTVTTLKKTIYSTNV